MWPNIKKELLSCSDDQLDKSMKTKMEEWPDNPSSIQILEVLDKCIFGSLASGFVVSVLQWIYDATLKLEGKTHEENIPLATWRNLE